MKSGTTYHDFKSIIIVDIILFGLIYFIVFEKKDINFYEESNLIERLKEKMGKIMQNEYHRRSPGALKYLRYRIKCSIEVYKEFVK